MPVGHPPLFVCCLSRISKHSEGQPKVCEQYHEEEKELDGALDKRLKLEENWAYSNTR